MKVFADTAGFFALLVSNDNMHAQAKEIFNSFAEQDTQLLTSSFVLVETIALLQRRCSLESVHDFHMKILPLLEVIWTDSDWYSRAMQRFIVQHERKLSLVDCLSFEIMDALEINLAFSFDKHFIKNGYTLCEQGTA